MKTMLVLVMVGLIFPFVAFADDMSGGLELLKAEKEAETIKVDKALAGRAKIGAAIGEPLGLTFGYHFSKTFEGNLLFGSNFGFDGLVVGGSGLFTIVNLDFGKTVLPLSLGPGAYFKFYDPFVLDLLGIARLEYNFKAPVNIYAEGGAGVYLFDDVGFAWTLAVGVRYVFR